MRSAIRSALRPPLRGLSPNRRKLSELLHVPLALNGDPVSGINLPTHVTRACAKWVTGFDGKLVKLNAHETGSEGMRYARNLFNGLDITDVANWTVDAGVTLTYNAASGWFRVQNISAGLGESISSPQVVGGKLIDGRSFLATLEIYNADSINSGFSWSCRKTTNGAEATSTNDTRILSSDSTSPTVLTTGQFTGLALNIGVRLTFRQDPTETPSDDFYFRLPTIEEVTGQANQNPSGAIPVDTAVGSDLVTNGSGLIDTTDWVEGNSVLLSADTSGLLVTENGGAAYGFSYTAVNVVAGKRYTVSVTPAPVQLGRFRIGTTGGGSEIYERQSIGSTSTIEHTFVATTSVIYIRCGLQDAVLGSIAKWGGISLKSVSTGLLVSGRTNGNTVNADGTVNITQGLPLRPKRTVKIGKSHARLYISYTPISNSLVVTAGQHYEHDGMYYQAQGSGAISPAASTSIYWGKTIGALNNSGGITFECMGYYTISGSNIETFASTNLQTQSNDLSHADWAYTAVNKTGQYAIAPNGKLDACLIVPRAAVGSHHVRQAKAVAQGLKYSQSYFVKAAGYDYVQVAASSGFNTNQWLNIDLTNGSQGNSGPKAFDDVQIEAVAEGWYRISVTADAIAANGSGQIVLVCIDTDVFSRIPSFAGDGVKGVLAWGGDFKQGPISSFVETTTAATTRVAETYNYALANHDNREGTVGIKIRFPLDKTDMPTGATKGILALAGSADSIISASSGSASLQGADGTSYVSGAIDYVANAEVRIWVTFGAGKMIMTSSSGALFTINSKTYDGGYTLGSVMALLKLMTVGCKVLDYVHTKNRVTQTQLEKLAEVSV